MYSLSANALVWFSIKRRPWYPLVSIRTPLLREGRTKDGMKVLFHKHVWLLYTEYMPTLHWWIGASSVSPYVIAITWGIASDIIIHHWSNAYELFTYCASLIYFSVALVTTTTKPKILLLPLLWLLEKLLLLLLPPLPLLPYYFATKYFVADIKSLAPLVSNQ